MASAVIFSFLHRYQHAAVIIPNISVQLPDDKNSKIGVSTFLNSKKGFKTKGFTIVQKKFVFFISTI